MHKPVRRLNELLKSPVVLCLLSTVGLIQALIWILQSAGKIQKLEWGNALLTHSFFAILTLIIYGIVLITGNFRRLRDSFAKVHDVNHQYRNYLAATSAKLLMIDGGDRVIEAHQLLTKTEKEATAKVLRIISDQFRLLINRDVVATLWIHDPSSDAFIEQETSANGVDADRPFRELERYRPKLNSIFCHNRKKKGRCCHYYSADIAESADSEDGYHDERPNYLEYYKSLLCVPIRFRVETDAGGKIEEDLLGFLQVDTKSRNRLNDKEHLYLLAAYADQLYNFLSLVRRNFILS